MSFNDMENKGILIIPDEDVEIVSEGDIPYSSSASIVSADNYSEALTLMNHGVDALTDIGTQVIAGAVTLGAIGIDSIASASVKNYEQRCKKDVAKYQIKKNNENDMYTKALEYKLSKHESNLKGVTELLNAGVIKTTDDLSEAWDTLNSENNGLKRRGK